MKCHAKTIRSGGSSFIHRLSFYTKTGSIKINLIVDDDKDAPHTHPWDFTSLLIIPYQEFVWREGDAAPLGPGMYEERHRMFSVVRHHHKDRHRVKLYRFLGIPIPALTIGSYSKKLTLCSFCESLGYCKEQRAQQLAAIRP